jgi:hypothetical protein
MNLVHDVVVEKVEDVDEILRHPSHVLCLVGEEL